MHGTATGHRIRVTFPRSLRAKALVVILLPVAVVLGNLGAALWFVHVNHRAEGESARIRDAQSAVATLQATALRAEADAAAFLIQRSDVADRQAYLAAAQRLADEEVTATRRSAVVPRTLRTELHAAEDDARAITSALGPAVAQPDSATAFLVATRLTVLGTDTRLADAMTAVDARVERMVIALRAAISSSGTDVVVVASVAAGATVVGGIGLSLLFADRTVRRVRRLEEATAALAAGRPPGPLPGGSDELGRLGRQLAETAELLRHHEDETQRARADLDAIMAASPLVSLRYDAERDTVVYVSPNVEATLGARADDVLADPAALTDRFHPDDVIWMIDALRAPADGRRPPTESHLRFRRPGDDDGWGVARVVVTGLDRGGLPGRGHAVAYVVDVTERVRTEQAADERRHLLESIFDASPDTIVVRDETDAVVLASSRASDLLGTQLAPSAGPDGEWEGMLERIVEPDRRNLVALIRRCRSGDTAAEPVIVSATDAEGVPRVFETRAQPVVADDGRVTGTVTVSRDITERIRLEESLRRASESAEAASSAKSEFLSRMSHELRTPLNAVLGFAQLLQLDELAPEQADFVDQIQRAGQHLLSLINEILDISRIESGHLSLSVEPVAVDPLMAEVAALLGPVAEPNRIHLQLATEATAGMHVLGDRQRLLQVLLNLGSNAVKYNRLDGLAVFHTTVEPDGWVRFAVTDTGPGIPPERRTELFVPFSRLGAERSDVEGTGVGLALSKHLVELMGGTIGVTSDPGRGSTFWVELRLADTVALDDDGFGDSLPAAARTPTGTTGGSGQPLGAAPAGDAGGNEPAGRVDDAGRPLVGTGGGTVGNGTGANGTAEHGAARAADDVLELPLVVLHVEDNESNAALVAQVLSRRRGVQLLYAGQARVGLELASRHRPDLILLDLHLPDLPGDEFLHRLRADPEMAGTRVVAVSADATPSRIRRMLGLGVEAYLTKPIDVPALLRLVDLVRLGRPVPQQHPAARHAGGDDPPPPVAAAPPGTERPDPAAR